MVYRTSRLFLRERDLINRQLLPRIVAAITKSYDKAPHIEPIPQLHPHASENRWAYALGAFGAAAATGITASAEPEVPVEGVNSKDPYAPPVKLQGVPKEIILYQYEVCPFCCKVKAFLDYHKLPYRTVEVSPLTKKQLKWSDYRKVPVALLDGEVVTDSTAIITRLAAELAEQEQQLQTPHASQSMWRKLTGGGSRRREKASQPSSLEHPEPADEEHWRRWVDERLVRLLTVNIYRNMRESFQTFDYITASSCNFGFLEREAARVVGATMMWGISGRLKKKYDIEGDVREELYKAANLWIDALGDQRFHGGLKPDLADLSVFGVLRSITCTDTFMDVMHTTNIGAWYEHMMHAVGDSVRLA